MTLATLSLNRARFANGFQLALQSCDAFLHTTTIHFQLRFTGATCSNTTSLSRQVMPHSCQPRQQILQLRQLDLQPAFAAARALGKNVENELGAIEHFARE